MALNPTKPIIGTVRFRMNRTQSNNEPDYMSVDMFDASSLTTVMRGKLSMESFAELLSGRTAEMGVELFTGTFGLVPEYKHVKVFVPDPSNVGGIGATYHKNRTEHAKKACAEYEIDGWKASYDDACNYHKAGEHIYEPVKGTLYRVQFTRYVEKTLATQAVSA